jgi:hypothetical protein
MTKLVDLESLEPLIELWNESRRGAQADQLLADIFPQIQAVRRTGQCTRNFSMVRQSVAQLDFYRVGAT